MSTQNQSAEEQVNFARMEHTDIHDEAAKIAEKANPLPREWNRTDSEKSAYRDGYEDGFPDGAAWQAARVALNPTTFAQIRQRSNEYFDKLDRVFVPRQIEVDRKTLLDALDRVEAFAAKIEADTGLGGGMGTITSAIAQEIRKAIHG